MEGLRRGARRERPWEMVQAADTRTCGAVREGNGPCGVPTHETRAGFPQISSPGPTTLGVVRRYGVPVHDAAYKGLFSRPRMVEDLLRGFVAPEWSGELDFSTLEKLPAEYVSDDLRRRHGNAVWRVRFRDRKWLYLLVMLEFQSTTDPYMAVRILVYTGLLYQDLIRRGAFGDDGRLPPALPVVLYNGRPRWTAPVEVGDLIAPVGEALAPFQPSQRYFLLDEGRWGEDDLPRRNLVSALVGLENSGSAESLSKVLAALSGWLRGSEDDELRRAFVEWVRQVVLPGRFPGAALPVVQALEGGGAMLAESVKEWTEQWFREGREQGLEQGLERGREQGLERGREQGLERGREQGLERGRAEERALLCRQASRKFDAETAERLSGLLDRFSDPERLAEVGEWIIESGTGVELLDRAERLDRLS